MVDSFPRVFLFFEKIDFDMLRSLPQYFRRMHFYYYYYYYYYITFMQSIDSSVSETVFLCHRALRCGYDIR